MIGMSLNEFMNKIYYGDEIEFKLDDITYFIQGNCINGRYSLTIDYWYSTDGSEPPHDYLFVLDCNSASERMEKFENAPIFNGRNIYEIESDIEVIFG